VKKYSIKNLSPSKIAFGHLLALHIHNTLIILMRLFGSEISLSCLCCAKGEMKKWTESVRAEIENKSKR
jgi:hypothetical protein